MKLDAACAALFFIGVAVAQQEADKPKFEVASIKPSDPAGTSGIRRSGYRIAFSNSSLLFLITWAYDLHSDRLYGQPKWLDSARYDIVGNATPESLGYSSAVWPDWPVSTNDAGVARRTLQAGPPSREEGPSDVCARGG